MPLDLSKPPVSLTPNLFFLGEIERMFSFETPLPGPRCIVMPDGSVQEDRLVDDTTLAYRSREGIVVITGCAHAGICNTVEYAKKICGENRVHDIIGGLHLRGTGQQLDGTLDYLKGLNLAALHACHCTALPAKVAPWHRLPRSRRLAWGCGWSTGTGEIRR